MFRVAALARCFLGSPWCRSPLELGYYTVIGDAKLACLAFWNTWGVDKTCAGERFERPRKERRQMF